MLQKDVPGFPLLIIENLKKEGGNQIEDGPDLGEVTKKPGHIVVRPDPVKPHPGKGISSRERIFIIRLVHVPQESDP